MGGSDDGPADAAAGKEEDVSRSPASMAAVNAPARQAEIAGVKAALKMRTLRMYGPLRRRRADQRGR